MTDVRPSVQRFALAMEQTLKENDHKRGWGLLSNKYLIDRLRREVENLKLALNNANCCGCKENEKCAEEARERILKEATDVANFAMMIADKLVFYYEPPVPAEKATGVTITLLPVGTEIYIVQDDENLWFRVREYSLLSHNGSNVRYWAECVTDKREDDLDFWSDDIGQSVFLTLEAAEAALKEAKEE
jgi:hypothetical protein